jgi:NAD(P)-dependent dehydrogenase (short-subunit alcohol dehydrogenase family)
MASMSGKVAFVTGGSSGIGRAAAIAFAREGAKVVVASRRSQEGDETIRLIKAVKGEGIFVKADVSQAAQVQAAVDTAVSAYGRLDYAFNNAGIEEPVGQITDQTEDTYDRIMDINVKGLWLSMKYEIPHMLKNGGGSIVNTSSVAGVVGFPAMPIYTASKHAVIGLTKAAALQYAKFGVRVNAVSPAGIDTDMLDRFVGENQQMRQQLADMHPIGRIGTPQEIAEAVLWLCSGGTSFVTGHNLLVDGGFTAQ